MTDRDSERGDPADPDAGSGPVVSDGGSAAEIDEERLYEIVHDAVEDAVLGVVGTLLLLGIGFVFLVSGATAVVGATSTAEFGVGLTVLLVGLVVFVTTLRGVLPVRRWV
ncbi:hypothetical protein [Halosimplex halophilum]|uniref:hypothetical protein n=1 Tax=Halosimplex halophilum TaxID=2559572 RepID=UPI00107F5FC4|nr:hypothetical protein [Halosimplex halophilum]